MSRLMQSVSALTLAAAMTGVPLAANAQQQTETEAEQVVEEVVQETEGTARGEEQAVEVIVEETDEAAQGDEQAVEVTEEETDEAAAATDEAPEPAEVTVVEETDQTGDLQDPAAAEGTLAGMPVEEVQGAIVMQDDNSFLTSDLIDAAIFNAAGDKVGEVEDAILSLDGTVEGVVIGVGGFLGIGQKHVAVEMQQISLHTDERGQPQLILDTTREALEAAPEFMTAADQQAEVERLEAQQAPAGGMSTSDMAPAAPPAPAEGAAAPTTTD